LLGAGVQAQSHLAAMLAVRPIQEVRVTARTVASAKRFVAAHRKQHPNVSFKAVQDARRAVEGADIICTETLAAEPILAADWLARGCHINAVGSHSPSAREIDSETMKRSRVVVDSREAALTECGDCMLPIREGHISPDHVSDEIGEVLAGLKPGRTDPSQTTIYQSCGLAVQDVAVSRFVYDKAVTQDIGLTVDWTV
jgi:ornithine cyclodeaminase/alanine dehydrogenase-like protein (mu-crystallin family)